MHSDLRRIEVLDEAMVDVLWRSTRKLLRGQLVSLHPEWDAAQIDREVAQRMSDESVRRSMSLSLLENAKT